MSSRNVCRYCLGAVRSISTKTRPAIRSSSSIVHQPPSSGSCPRSSPPRQILVAGQHRRLASEAVNQQQSPSVGAKYETPALRGQSNQRPAPQDQSKVFLRSDNLFHPLSRSPVRSIRERAQYMQMNAYCPHPSHQPTRAAQAPSNPVPGSTPATQPPAHVRFECPDCGIPTYCSEEHWADDYENHIKYCDVLRQANEDDHDLHSGRGFPEFENPGSQIDEILPNMTNWDTLLYTREHRAINSDRSMRQATRMLTYPMTIASVLHELSPYGLRNRLTVEGLKSLTALRYTLHPPRSGAGLDIKGLRPTAPPVRLFILGARAESSLPRDVWVQLTHLFPRSIFHLIFIGPESMVGRERELPLPDRTASNPFGAVTEDRLSSEMKISTFVEYYQTMHQTGYFEPYDPYFDAFVLFHPGLGHPASSQDWELAVRQMLETKVPILCTGFTQWDMQRDLDWVQKTMGGEVDVLMNPGENIFRSLRWDLNDDDPQGDISCGNWGVWAFRGKRYETMNKEDGTIAL